MMVPAVHGMMRTTTDGWSTLNRQTMGNILIWMAMEVAVCPLTHHNHNIVSTPFPADQVLRSKCIYTTSLEMEDVQIGKIL